MTFAVVLGGGGSAGVAWEVGVLLGLAEAGLDVTAADLLVGTSAGSIVSAQLSSDLGIEAMYERVRQPVNLPPMELDFAAITLGWATAAEGATSADEARAQIGAQAMAADTMTPEKRRGQIAALLPEHTWPTRPIAVTAVSAMTGKFAVFTRESGVDFVAAVGASCAVPGVWPCVQIGDEYFMDGAVRSPTNTSVALGYSHVLVLAPLLPVLGGGIEREVRQLGPDTVCEVIAADDGANTAFGPNPLDANTGPAAAIEGLRQGREAAERARPIFG
jgi:NTE family protein